MFGLAAPVWLAAFAALLVPLAIHLWSRRSRRVVPLGTLRFLKDAPAARAASLRIADPLLLILRMAAVAVLVLLLAGLYLRRTGAPETVVLVSADVLRDDQALATDPVIDSIRRAGGPVYLMAKGLPRTTLGLGPSRADTAPPGTIGVWDALVRTARRSPDADRILVIAPRELSDASGPRPAIGVEVRWHAPALHRPTAGVERAWVAGGEVHLVVRALNDGPWSVSRRHVALPLPAPGARGLDGAIEVTRTAGDSVLVRTLPGNGEPAGAPTLAAPLSARRIAVVAGADREDDARYVEAGLRALIAATGVPITFVAASQIGTLGAGDWIIGLGTVAPTDAAMAAVTRGTSLLVDTARPDAAVPRAGAVAPNGPLGVTSEAPVFLRTMTTADSGAPLLGDSEGQPLLTASRVGAGLVYRFHARFHPEWTGLVLGAGLPELLGALIAPGILPGPVTGTAPVSMHQALPRRADTRHSTAAQALTAPLAALAALLFLLERFIAGRRARRETAA